VAAKILYGKDIAKQIGSKLAQEVEAEVRRRGRAIKLATVRIGAFENARLYEQSIGRMTARFGVAHEKIELEPACTLEEVRSRLGTIASREDVTAILLLSPVPKGLNYGECVNAVPSRRDAEGTRYDPRAVEDGAYPPTALACLEMVLASGVRIEGAHAVVVGRSNIVGRPVAELLLKRHATLTICHSRTRDLDAQVGRADILVAATGKPHLIKGAWVKPGAVVVDAGESVVDGKPVGDVEFTAAAERAAFITPVPSGVGPVTSLMLVRNLLALSRTHAR